MESKKTILAFDGGGTRTRAGFYKDGKSLSREATCGPSNPAELGLDAAVSVLTSLADRILGKKDTLDAVAVGIAGAAEPEMREKLAAALCRRLNAAETFVSDDRWPLLFANGGNENGVVVIAGTGSGVLAQTSDGKHIVIGGRGSLMGDGGSAYHVALRALRACAEAVDGTGPETLLVSQLRKAAAHKDLSSLARWTLGAAKGEIAALAEVVTSCAQEGDPVALACMEAEAASLVRQTEAAFTRLSLPEETFLYLSGGLFEKAALWKEAYEKALATRLPGAVCKIPRFTGHQAVALLAQAKPAPPFVATCSRKNREGKILPPTEEQLSNAPSIDTLSSLEIVRLMNREDEGIPRAVAREESAIAKTITIVAEAFSNGGRLIYGGAGTSGRLGVLDASECPPTFGVGAEKVIGLIAGGDPALRRSMEGAEDSRTKGKEDLGALTPWVNEKDVVVGISASGTAPYVLGMLEEAKKRGASAVLLCCNPDCRDGAPVVIAVETGPEVLPGSTRLKGGTATKMVLNMITTGAMALAGYVYEGLMVGMTPANTKLSRRAAGIIKSLTGKDENAAEDLLSKSGNNIAVAVLMAKRDFTREEAERRLKEKGCLRKCLQEKGHKK